MSLYTRPESSLWYYEFRAAGQRYRGSTGTPDIVRAEAFEAEQRFKALSEAKQASDDATQFVKSLLLYEVAGSWLAHSKAALQDHKGNISRVRKLFGREMRLAVGGEWVEMNNARYGLSQETRILDLTPSLLQMLRCARVNEGASAATIERELSLLRVLEAHAETMRPPPPEPVPPTALELVITGRRSLKKLRDIASPAGRKRTPADHRTLWRDVGVALRKGRDTRPVDRDFDEWCYVAGFTLSTATREAAMWLAEHWEEVRNLQPLVADPVVIRRVYENRCK